jgi:hypothetical protein
MAFAVAVVQGQKKLSDCPQLSKKALERLGGAVEIRNSLENDQEQILADLKQKVASINLLEAADRLGVPFFEGKVGITCLGKEFWIDSSGTMTSQCHTNHWVYLPLLQYVLSGKGTKPQGSWLNFGGLKGATQARAQYFSHRCEEPLRQLADAHTDLFFELLHLFGAKKETGITKADYCLVIEPLPNVLFMINYWPPEDDFSSQLTLLFDRTTPDNLDLDSLYLISRGLVEMFRELLVKHSKSGKLF